MMTALKALARRTLHCEVTINYIDIPQHLNQLIHSGSRIKNLKFETFWLGQDQKMDEKKL